MTKYISIGRFVAAEAAMTLVTRGIGQDMDEMHRRGGRQTFERDRSVGR